MKKLIIVLMAIVIMGGSVSLADFQGHVMISVNASIDLYYDPLNLLHCEVQEGSHLFGSFMYEVPWLDSRPAENIAEYRYTGPDFQNSWMVFMAGGLTFRSDRSDSYWEFNLADNVMALDSSLEDRYRIISYKNLPVRDDIPVLFIDWLLTGDTDCLSSVELPTEAPVLSDWAFDSGIRIIGGEANVPLNQQFIIEASIYDVSVMLFPTPEPATILILGMGCVFLIRKKKANKC